MLRAPGMVPAAASSRDLTSKSRARPEARSERSSGSETVGSEERGTRALREAGLPPARLPRGPPHLAAPQPGGGCVRTPPPLPFAPPSACTSTGGVPRAPKATSWSRPDPRSPLQLPPAMVRTANASFRNLAPARPPGAGSISPALPKLQLSRDPPEPEAKAPPPAQPPPHLFPMLLALAREVLAIVGVDGQRHIGPAQLL